MKNNIFSQLLTENTGRHLLDSGDAYGRNWQRNQGRDFQAEPPVTVDFKYGIEVTLNVYHFLNDRLSLASDLDADFQAFAEGSDCERFGLAAVDAWLEKLASDAEENGTEPPAGLYGEGKPFTVNTYNGESLLSQVIQYTYFTLGDDAYVALQIHGGCDVRGGYTAPRIFSIDGAHDETSIFDNARASIGCDSCDAFWTTDDGCNWYRDGACGHGAGAQLETYDRTEEKNGDAPEAGKMHVKEDGSALCPCCGTGNLRAGS